MGEERIRSLTRPILLQEWLSEIYDDISLFLFPGVAVTSSLFRGAKIETIIEKSMDWVAFFAERPIAINYLQIIL